MIYKHIKHLEINHYIYVHQYNQLVVVFMINLNFMIIGIRE